MPQAASFTVNDRASTPVGHTFAPKMVSNDVATFAETASVPIGERKFTISWRKSGTNYKARVVFADPVLVTEVINGVNVPKVSTTNYVDTTFTFSEKSTLQERKNTVGMYANGLGASVTVIDGVLTGLEGIW